MKYFLVVLLCFVSILGPPARRDVSVVEFLEVSVRVPGGSGTICYYDQSKNLAYVLTCAHVFAVGTKPYVEVYWVNRIYDKRRYKAKLLLCNEDNDVALMSFEPDFTPSYCPIAPSDSLYWAPTKVPQGKKLVVCGRDNGEEPAMYEAITRKSRNDKYLESYQHQSNSGRSGGGVMTLDRSRLVAVNYGRLTGKVGHGLWVPLWKIHRVLKDGGFYWLTKLKPVNKRTKLSVESPVQTPQSSPI